ncbi:MAG: hypothetical protein C5B51_17350 [Terriglobia bacterium]|nr:MAG: hypothetical protein C5B51_17350 [Terriglobia bacterium]
MGNTAPFLLPKAPKPKRARARVEPEISWTHVPRIEPGQYPARSRKANVYFDRQFKRWVCAVQFDVLDSSLVEVIASLTWFLNLGPREKPKATRRSKFWTACLKANGGQPKRRDRITARIFEGRYAVVRVEDTRKNHRQIAVNRDECYSVIRDVIEWQTGGPSR